MALIKCPECGREISDKAFSCPGCGYPYIQEEKERLDKIRQEKLREKEIEEQQKKEKLNSSFSIDLPKNFRFEKNQEKFFVYQKDELKYVGYIRSLKLKKITQPAGMRNGHIVLIYIKDTIKLPIEDEKQAKHICEFCGIYNTGNPIEKATNSANEKPVENKEFHGIYKYTFLNEKKEVYCPRCGSEDCSYFTEKKVIAPEKTKATYSANLNPLKPFTFVNKKEKVVSKEVNIDVKKIQCNKCGKIFS